MNRLRAWSSRTVIGVVLLLGVADVAEARPPSTPSKRVYGAAQPDKAVAAEKNVPADAVAVTEVPPVAALPGAGRARARPRVHLIAIDSSINPATADFIREAVAGAAREQAALLVIELDTPGGLLESAKSIVKELLGAPLPVVVYVAPSGAGATSAGVFVAMAANIAAMAPGTTIGAAHPVGGQGENIQGDMREKVENFTVSLSKSIATERGRNVEWAEKAVRQSLSITADEAVKENVVDLIASSRDDLLKQLHGREVKIGAAVVRLNLTGAEVVTHEMRLRQKLLDILSSPNVAYLLMMAGLLGLYVEFTNPGVFFPGVVGGICLLLAMAALQVLPINYSGLALIGLGVALLVSELFLPTFGTLGIGGIVAFVLGSLLLFDTPESDLSVDPNLVYAAAATFAGFSLLISYLIVRTQRGKASLGAEGLIGEVGEVRQRISGEEQLGKVLVHGEYWNATADVAIEVQARVEVTKVDGLRLTVRPLRQTAPKPA